MNDSNAAMYTLAFQEMTLQAGQQVLEIGFGNGHFFGKILAQAPDLQVAGLDFSAEMVQAATETNQASIRSGALSLHFGSSDVMPFADASFDKIFCINVVYFWENPADHLREIKRVLKPGGRFYAIIRPKEAMERMPFTQFGFHLYAPADWEAVLLENGFSGLKQAAQLDPPFMFEGTPMQLTSVCISGEIAST